MLHHKRRYRAGQLRRLADAAGLRVVTLYYFNFLLFIPIWSARQALRFSRSPAPETQLNNPILNAMLRRIFAVDVRLAPLIRPPFGVSILMLVRKGG
jgi:hypothetical protein